MREEHLTGYWCGITPVCLAKRLSQIRASMDIDSKHDSVSNLTALSYLTTLCYTFGAHGARETPVPMPNTEVKPRSGYNTWGPPLGK
jgi:hypothetical protein